MKLKNLNLFTILTKFLIIVLPFYVIIKVFFEIKLGIKFFGLAIKELILLFLILSLVYEFIKKGKIPRFDILDILIFTYFGYGILITIVNGLGLKSILYGGRYDYIFFTVLLIYRHGAQFLKIKIRKLLKLLVRSMSISLLLGIIIRVIGEEYLTIFGYDYYVGNWQFSGSIPIYHGVENSGLKRFQGILDGPNQMAFFLILFSGLIGYINRKKLEFYHLLIFILLFILFLLTYSRSALLGFFSSIGLLFILNINLFFKKYIKIFISGIILLTILGGFFYIFFETKISKIFLRASSTSGHIERMEIGIKKFLEKPLGHGLATSGPAYRSIYTENNSKKEEKYFIPESWFIQQLVEGGIIYFFLFITILTKILFKLRKKYISIFTAFFAILIMNIFLHIFEATYLSIITFIIIGLLLQNKKLYKTNT